MTNVMVMEPLLQRQNEQTATGNASAAAPAAVVGNSRERMLTALNLGAVDRPPVWLMRQAGRCLPEYRELKKEYTFRELIHTPELAAEITVQPIRRFGFDAAILFSDILVVPEALGQGFRFRDTGGVEMKFTLQSQADIEKLDATEVAGRLQYVASALRAIKKELGGRTALLGFAGSPWTLANFMLEGGSSNEFTKALELFRKDRRAFDLLAGKLAAAVTEFLQLQIDSGVDAVQLFDSLGGLLPGEDFEAASGSWMRQIIEGLRGQVPVIVFAKGVRRWNDLVKTGAKALGIDHGIDILEASRNLPASVALQGNFDPDLLTAATPATVAAEAKVLLKKMRGRRGYIFNLGHGVPAEAKLENLEALVGAVKGEI